MSWGSQEGYRAVLSGGIGQGGARVVIPPAQSRHRLREVNSWPGGDVSSAPVLPASVSSPMMNYAGSESQLTVRSSLKKRLQLRGA